MKYLFVGIAAALVCLPSLLGAATASSGNQTSVNWKIAAADIASTCDADIKRTDTAIKAMLARKTRPTFQSVVKPLEDITADLNDDTVAQQFLVNVADDKASRDASLKCDTDQSDYFNELTARPELYRAVAAAAKSNTAKTVYDKKLTAIWLTQLKRSGAGLGDADRKEFINLQNKLTDLQNQFNQNLANDATTISISPSEIDGIPKDILAGYKRGDGGSYVVPVNESTFAFMLNASNENARKTYFFAYANRGGQKNVALLESAIAVRDRLAHLLGYETWAAFVLADRMAGSPDRVAKFLKTVDTAILPQAKEERAHLRDLKAKLTGDPNAVLNPWDTSYYDNYLRKTQYAVDEDQVRQYFPVQHVLDSVLNFYHTMLGVNFTQITPSDAWDPQVFEYRVDDTATGKLLGYTYFDLFPRPGKYDHFANFPILPVRDVNGTMRPPIATIVGNWPKPASGQPALLSHSDVITFFHEFGHDLAALLTAAPYESLSGFRQDFVEAPSQMLENFAWQPSILKSVSSNWKTGQPLPDDLIQKMIAARYVDYSSATTGQILYASVDQAFHTSGPHVDTTAVWASLAPQLTPAAMAPNTVPQAAFGHLMSGYDAQYYSYLWALVYAQDMFTAFQDGGIDNPSVGLRYRQDILAPARTYEPDVEIKNFLGRPMNPDAFYKTLGIKNP